MNRRRSPNPKCSIFLPNSTKATMASMTKPMMPHTNCQRPMKMWSMAASADGVGEDAPFELTLDSEADQGEMGAPREPASRLQDELLLDADRLVEKDEPVQDNVGGRRRGLLGGAGSDSPPASSGSTLFERMANLSRGAAKSEDDKGDDEDEDEATGPSLSIPRFLGRQNNQ